MPTEREEIRKSITSKGFIHEPDRDHDYYWLFDGNKKTQWWIRLSRSPKYKVYSDDLVKRQARILGVTFGELIKFLDCTSDKVKFLAILRERDSTNH